jgi:hypothetical protein
MLGRRCGCRCWRPWCLLTHQAEEALPLFLGSVLCFLYVVVLSVYISSASTGEGPSFGLVFVFLLWAGPIIMLAPFVLGVGFGVLVSVIVVGGYYHREYNSLLHEKRTCQRIPCCR